MRTFAERAIAKKAIRVSRKSETALTIHGCTIRRAVNDWLVLHRGKAIGRADLLVEAEMIAETAMLKRAIAVDQAKKRIAERRAQRIDQGHNDAAWEATSPAQRDGCYDPDRE